MANILTPLIIFGIFILFSMNRTRSSSPPPNRSASPPGKSPHPSAVSSGHPATAEAHATEAHATEAHNGGSPSSRQVTAQETSESLSGDEAFSLESENVGEAPIQIISLDEEKKKHHRLDFSESGILNGIILSEILGPPAARRKRIR